MAMALPPVAYDLERLRSMEPTSFLSALLAIVVIDLVLAGDNAIVIALAARSLPQHLQRRAIVWGAFGAIAVRSLMTVIVVWLLKIPGLLLAGALALLWIAYRLMLPDEEPEDPHAPAATGFWGAMRTIVIADAVMGLDNVLAVAGAAHGSYLLVVTGLLISVPIVVWGSTVVLKIVDRYPGIVYLGAGVLVWTAAKMASGEPLLAPAFGAVPSLRAAVYLAIPLVLWLGFARNHRRIESRIDQRLATFLAQRPQASRSPNTMQPQLPVPPEEKDAMLKVLVPVDGSTNALGAVRHAIKEFQRHALELHLLNVQPPLSRHIARFVSRNNRLSWHQEQADGAMATARGLLAQAGVPHRVHRAIGDRADEICRAAAALGVHHIVLGTARKNSVTRMLEDSVTNRVLQDTPVPVEVVAGAAISNWERWGLRVGVLCVGGLILLAIS